MESVRASCAWMLLLALGLWGCAPQQRVRLELAPAPLEVYLDGERIDVAGDGELELRADRPHVLFFKKAGHLAERVVLESVREDGRPRLAPEHVRVELSPQAPKGRELTIELDR